MPIGNITAYRVFIGSPAGLEKERQAFRQTLLLYNETDAIHAGVLFVPVGWEDTLGGVGRPQSIINEDLRKCDFAVLMFWNRWGSAPDRDGSRFTSGTEEEFHVALECLRDNNSPMSQMVTFFKAVPAKNFAEPSDQLARVLEFRKQLESEKEHLFHVFDSTRSFETLLRRHFGAWLRSIREGGKPARIPLAQSALLQEARDDRTPVAQATDRSVLDEARRLANVGKRTEAEALLTKAVVRDDDPNALIAYAWFLQQEHRLEQARGYLDRALELSRIQGDRIAEGNTLRRIGALLLKQADTAGAENMYHAALELLRGTGHEEGIAACLNGLGAVLLDRGELDPAERNFRQALTSSELAGDDESSGIYSANLGVVLREKRDFGGAIAALRKAIELDQRAENRAELARAQLQLGRAYQAANEPTSAERWLLRSVAMYERVGNEIGVSTSCSFLGTFYVELGDLPRAEQMYRRCLEIDQRIGTVLMIAGDEANLGTIMERRGDWVKARELYSSALAASTAAGNVEDMARYSMAVAAALWNGGDIESSRKTYAAAHEHYSDLGDRSGMANSALWQANALRATGPAADAERWYDEAVRLYVELGSDQGILRALDAFATFLEGQGRTAEAGPVLRRALDLVEHDATGDAAARLNLRLGRIAEAEGDVEAATVLYRRSAELDASDGNYARADTTMVLLSGISTAPEATEIFQSLYDSGRRTLGGAVSHYVVGARWVEAKNAAEAESVLLRGIAIAQEVGNVKVMALCRSELAKVGVLLHDPSRVRLEVNAARDLYTKAGDLETAQRMEDTLAKLLEEARRQDPLGH